MVNAGICMEVADPLIGRITEALVEADARRLQMVALHLNEALVAMTGRGLAPPASEVEPVSQPH